MKILNNILDIEFKHSIKYAIALRQEALMEKSRNPSRISPNTLKTPTTHPYTYPLYAHDTFRLRLLRRLIPAKYTTFGYAERTRNLIDKHFKGTLSTFSPPPFPTSNILFAETGTRASFERVAFNYSDTTFE